MADETRSLLAHLYRRAGWGAKKVTLDTWAIRGYDAAVDDLVAAAPAGTPGAGGSASSSGIAGVPKKGPIGTGMGMGMGTEPEPPHSSRDMQAQWVKSMVENKSVLSERMTLFYANHFATRWSVDLQSLVNELALFRKFSMGSFRDLAHALLDDLALSCFLNNQVNVKEAPNENLGRELMELFTLGRGNFTERDVKETARALTGYALQEKKDAKGSWSFTLIYDPARHDNGVKTVLGTSANFTPHQVLDHLLNQPAAPRFIAGKLVSTFLSPAAPSAAVETVAQSLIANNWKVAPALSALFKSPQFKSPSARETLVKSPAEFVVGAMRALGSPDYRSGSIWIESAGQGLFDPPTVAGWPSGEQWLAAGSMLARYNIASALGSAHAKAPNAAAPKGYDIAAWTEAFGMTALAPSTEAAIQNYLTNTRGQSEASRTAGLVTLLAASPDYCLA